MYRQVERPCVAEEQITLTRDEYNTLAEFLSPATKSVSVTVKYQRFTIRIAVALVVSPTVANLRLGFREVVYPSIVMLQPKTALRLFSANRSVPGRAVVRYRRRTQSSLVYGGVCSVQPNELHSTV